jgi:hypothetical protein
MSKVNLEDSGIQENFCPGDYIVGAPSVSERGCDTVDYCKECWKTALANRNQFESPWGKEPPIEPGWYRVVIKPTKTKGCIYHSSEGGFYSSIDLWGPRIDFPLLPEDDK